MFAKNLTPQNNVPMETVSQCLEIQVSGQRKLFKIQKVNVLTDMASLVTKRASNF